MGRTKSSPTRTRPTAERLLRAGRYAEAEAMLRTDLAARPNDAPVLTALAFALSKQGRHDESAAAAQQAIARDATNAHAHMLRGVALANLGRHISGLNFLERALALGEDTFAVHDGLGCAHFRLGDLDTAITHLRRAVMLGPNEASVHSHLAVVLSASGCTAEARAAHDQACRLAPGDALLRMNRALALLADGDLDRGWEEYDHGFAAPARGELRHCDVARWDGRPLSGVRLLVYREQGLGDELIFGSCYPDLASEADHLVIECRGRLVPLFARTFPNATVCATRDTSPRPSADFAIPSGSVARHRRRALADFPDAGGYLAADAARVAYWRAWLATLPGAPVGVSWRSGLVNAARRDAYPPLEEWEPVFTNGATFVCLQYDDSTADRALIERRYSTEIVVPPDLDLRDDLDGVAALAAALGTVVSVDNAVAALAGSVGARTLVLTPAHTFTALGTDRWPWLPTVQTFDRQRGDTWQPAMMALAAELNRPADPTSSS